MQIAQEKKTEREYYAEARALVLEVFDGDEEKADDWFETKNPFFGNKRPADFIRAGRGERALKVIRNLINGELP